MKVLVKVTKDILKRSAMCQRQDSTRNCAIALAVRDLFPRAVIFNFDFIPDVISDPHSKIEMPIQATMFIEKFDRNNSPEMRMNMPELSFEIDVPSEVIDSIGIGQAYKVLSESRTLELVHP